MIHVQFCVVHGVRVNSLSWARWLRYVMLYFFFFQAEDGIRDLVRSRGLGDVYKRQGYSDSYVDQLLVDVSGDCGRTWTNVYNASGSALPVSYTHLTLPTSDLV